MNRLAAFCKLWHCVESRGELGLQTKIWEGRVKEGMTVNRGWDNLAGWARLKVLLREEGGGGWGKRGKGIFGGHDKYTQLGNLGDLLICVFF